MASPVLRLDGPLNAIVVGGDANVWDDLHALPRRWWHLVVAVNDIGMYLPFQIHGWVTLHIEKLAPWRAIRRENYRLSEDYAVYTRRQPYKLDKTIGGVPQLWHPGGTSAMLGVNAARELGATRIVLCGCGIDNGPHFYGGKEWTDAFMHRDYWQWLYYADKLGDVHSMSGWTSGLLGAPDFDEWHAPFASEDMPTL